MSWHQHIITVEQAKSLNLYVPEGLPEDYIGIACEWVGATTSDSGYKTGEVAWTSWASLDCSEIPNDSITTTEQRLNPDIPASVWAPGVSVKNSAKAPELSQLATTLNQ
jgi:hypothetical protein